MNISSIQDEIAARRELLGRLLRHHFLSLVLDGRGAHLPGFPAGPGSDPELQVLELTLERALEHAFDAVESALIHPGRARSGPGKPAGKLTESETRILRYLPTNLRVPEIAERLCVSVHTVRTHTRHVYEKLSVHNRTQAVEQARALGLLAPAERGWSRQPAG